MSDEANRHSYTPEADRQTDRHTDRQTNQQTDRQTDTQTGGEHKAGVLGHALGI